MHLKLILIDYIALFIRGYDLEEVKAAMAFNYIKETK